MRTLTKPLLDLTAGDLMNPDVIRIPEGMALQDVARLLLRNQIGGAPVVDADGKCVGVISATDFLRQMEMRADVNQLSSKPPSNTCSFQRSHTTTGGVRVTRCTLPPDVCPIQVKQEEPGGETFIRCSQPQCVLVDWQMLDTEKLPKDEVRQFMTPDPVTTQPITSIRVLAQMMIDGHIHRIIVVDKARKPVGIVSSTDLLATLAYAEPTHDGDMAERECWGGLL